MAGARGLVPAKLRRVAASRLSPRVLALLGRSQEDDATHPERLAVLPYLTDRCVEIGCGYRKTLPESIGVDLVPGGEPGRIGNVAGRASQADAAADGAQLPFRDRSFDSLVARHNLEHYVDTLAVLAEWRRVLAPAGRLVLVVPDEEHYDGRTLDLDPTHYHGFSQASLRRLVQAVGFSVVDVRVVVPNWSFMLVATR
jgi:SAM-dependent methyltransferase